MNLQRQPEYRGNPVFWIPGSRYFAGWVIQ
jgi:hypothetical protein